MKKYIISEEELKELILARPESSNKNTIKVLNEILIKQVIKSAQPIELITSGKQEEVKRDFIHWITFKNPYPNLDIYVVGKE